MAVQRKKGLGKGLEALFEDNHVVDEVGITTLKISEIEPNANQPRVDFDDQALRELADSIALHGVLQPLVVRPLEAGGYQIVAGERRWRASRMSGISEVPVVVKELTDSETLEIAIIENLQREDLNVIELALGYKSLINEHNMTQDDVAKKVGKSRPVVANSIRLLNLPSSVVDEVRKGKISQGHARALLAIEDEELLLETAKKVIQDKILVRDIEKLSKQAKNSEPVIKKEKQNSWGDSYYKEMELALSENLARKVHIEYKENKGRLILEFYDQEDLNKIAAMLTQE